MLTFVCNGTEGARPSLSTRQLVSDDDRALKGRVWQGKCLSWIDMTQPFGLVAEAGLGQVEMVCRLGQREALGQEELTTGI